MLIKARKAFLPLKWWVQNRLKDRKTEFRGPEEVRELKKKLTNKLRRAERLEQRMEVKVLEGKLEVLNWIAYDRTEEKAE